MGTIKIIKKAKPILITLSILLILLISITAISATNNITDKQLNTNNQLDEISTINQTLQSTVNSQLLQSEETGTFADLNTDLKGKTGEIALSKNYTYNSSTDSIYKNGILLSDGLIINGNGHTINGNDAAKAFIITGTSTVAINNLTFTNCKSANGTGNNSYGGVILSNNTGNLTIINCTFTNNLANVNGGCVCMRSDSAIANSSLIVVNSTFINNTVNSNGGALFIKNGNLTVNDCIFINNVAKDWGGALSSRSGNTIINNGYFLNNTAYSSANSNKYGGGAIYIGSDVTGFANCTIYNSNFTLNKINQFMMVEQYMFLMLVNI